ncbi:Transposase IS204/IS1001/IS1096/IS1165 zinc-finger domain-containing protein [Alkalicoccus chagannorensis]
MCIIHSTTKRVRKSDMHKSERLEGELHLHIELKRKPHRCPDCDQRTKTIHDYRLEKIQHLKMWERPTVLFYRRRRYICACGKRFAEKYSFVERCQGHNMK